MLRVMDRDEQAARLRNARKQAGFEHAAEAARSLGIKEPTYRSHENGTRPFDHEFAQQYGRRFRVPPEWLLFGPGVEPPEHVSAPSLDDDDAASGFSGEAVPADVPAPELAAMRNDVPVLGTAAASSVGGFRLSRDLIDVVPRPRGLMSARDVYAIFVAGDSMAPAHSAGELRYVSPHRPCRPGDTVLVRFRAHDGAEETAFLGILVEAGEKAIRLRKLNPEHEVSHDRTFVRSMHKVLTLNEIMGV